MPGSIKIIKRIILSLLIFFGTFNLNAQQTKHTLLIVPYSENEPVSSSEISNHMSYMNSMYDNHQILLSGELNEIPGYFYILNTGDKSIAKNWISGDSLILKKSRKIEYRPFTLIYEKVCDENIAHQKNTAYTLILNNTYLTKFNIREAPHYHREHENFIKSIVKTGNVLLWGIFDNTDGTIILMQGSTNPEIFSLDPMVQIGFIVPEVKDITLSPKIFCK